MRAESVGRRASGGWRRPQIVVLGNLTKMPVAGVAWQTMHYCVGLQRLGYDVTYVEAHARTPSMLMTTEDDDSTDLAGAYLDALCERFGLSGRWAFHALHDDGAVIGLSEGELRRRYRDAALILNLHGGTEPLEEHAATGRLVYVETDPVQLQVELAEGVEATHRFLDAHCAYFTFGENYGRLGCGLPVSDRYHFQPTRQPVVLDFWPQSEPVGDAFTTIGNWRQLWRPVTVGGRQLSWSKHVEFEKVLELPSRTGQRFELALSSVEPADVERLRAHGWRVREALPVSTDVDIYRAYISAALGELTVAKEQNVVLRTGWFSDRSATFLAAGRPVITQDTGFGEVLPTGEGLFAFADLEGAAAAVAAVAAEPARHRRAARAVARAYLSHDVVLPPLLEACGLDHHRRRPTTRRPVELAPAPLAAALDLRPISKRPTRLAPETLAYLLGPSVAYGPGEALPPLAAPLTSVVVVSWNNLPFLRLCVASVLAASNLRRVELHVVDNASVDGSREFLERAAAYDERLIVHGQPSNLGFAGAVNVGLAHVHGDQVCILNDDVVVADGWLDGFANCLADLRIGLCGPLTNDANDPNRFPIDYSTLGDFFAHADRLRRESATRVVPFLRLFAVALRRQVLDAIGGLDERFEVGLFEDDDYCERMRRAGYLLACAESVLVHHFGEVSFGKLKEAGHYADVFNANRSRFEHKWGTSWQRHAVSQPASYLEMVDRVGAVLRDLGVQGRPMAVLSRGDDALVQLCGPAARHFPRTGNTYAGEYPLDGIAAVALLEGEITEGVDYLVVPATAAWWLQHYVEFTAFLDASAQLIAHVEDVCHVFRFPRHRAGG